MGSMGVAIGGTAYVAREVEPYPQLAAADATGGGGLLFRAGVHGSCHRK